MAKNNIDEKILQESIAKGIPKPMGYTPPSYDKTETENLEIEASQTKSDTTRRTMKLKSEIYINTYLGKKDLPDRQLLYVSKDTHKRLSNFVKIVGGEGVTLSSYADAILRQHIEDNKDLINGLFKAHLEYPAE